MKGKLVKSVGILGGTGPAGKAFAVRLADAGYEVVIGSRSQERGEEIVAEVLAEIAAEMPDSGFDSTKLTGGSNEQAAECEIVVVATPWEGAQATASALSEVLAGKVVISMVNALMRIDKEFQPLMLPRGSVAESIQAVLPDSKVAATMHHVPAKELGALGEDVDCDVLICADNSQAAEVATELVAAVPGLRPLFAGGLSVAAPVEAFTAVLLQLNVINKTRVGLRFTGLD